jgi:hypothetical protein
MSKPIFPLLLACAVSILGAGALAQTATGPAAWSGPPSQAAGGDALDSGLAAVQAPLAGSADRDAGEVEQETAERGMRSTAASRDEEYQALRSRLHSRRDRSAAAPGAPGEH